ncbi:hypothetical protein Ami103574_10815 [Aminipila butyrica]|uniref:SAF domain-containing protein n=1 Tax=Aminipila butyrica TaxID=433296 RepID=A0A858BXY9_9FIRM|nr:RcpC/CpaB family pilus assembly protein [Aminipila butyrica]QIB69780.1 hypothetical protein Ami103574_10815 [Aminipila butyrica]
MGLFSKKPKPTALKSKSSFEKRKLFGILLIIIALVISFVVTPILSNSKNQTETIAIAKNDIRKGTVISESEISFAERGVFGLKGYITKKADVIGKPAAADISQGDNITTNKIGKENISRLQAIINEQNGLTTISIKSNAAGLASHLRAGDIVKVYNIIEDEYSGNTIVQNPDLQRVEIYDIENADAESIDKNQSKGDLSSSNEKVASTITFITSPDQERALLQAEYNGSIHVVFVER